MPEYVLGQSEQESKRLISQASLIETMTTQMLATAGVSAGMRVLDLGCGAGDVSMLAGKLVGPTGGVVGIDRDPGVLAVASQRAAESGVANISFVNSTIETYVDSQPFDALVGRFVLLYQASPVSTLARASGFVRPGGVILCMETDMSTGLQSHPAVGLWHQTGEWIWETFRRAKIHDDMGAKLYSTFLEAGLPEPQMRYVRAVGGGAVAKALCNHYADMIRSILPRMESFKIACAQDIQVDTLAARMESAIAVSKAQVYSMPMVVAWTRNASSCQSH